MKKIDSHLHVWAHEPEKYPYRTGQSPPGAQGDAEFLLGLMDAADIDGSLITKINLTSFNPDPNSTCGQNYDTIKIAKPKSIEGFNLIIPGDISSSAFFIVLTLLTKNSKLLIKNININPSRLGVIKILNKMGAKIKLLNIKKINNEKTADIFVKSVNNLKGINCPSNLNSSAIDEFLIIFLVEAKAKGISYFKNLNELNQK